MAQKNQEIDSLAADWATRRDLRTLSPEEEAEFQDWLAADPRHLGAYGRAEAVLCRVERLNGTALDEAPPEKTGSSSWNRRRLMLAGGAAASVAAGIGVAVQMSETARENSFSTAIGQIREVVLEDGSVVFLNTDTKIRVRFNEKLRDISLLQGEAQFDVAKNKERPFIVSAGDARVERWARALPSPCSPKGRFRCW